MINEESRRGNEESRRGEDADDHPGKFMIAQKE
jgi:hypothetical protein